MIIYIKFLDHSLPGTHTSVLGIMDRSRDMCCFAFIIDNKCLKKTEATVLCKEIVITFKNTICLSISSMSANSKYIITGAT